MPGSTPLYKLPFVIPADGLATLPTTDRSRAEMIEAVLKNRGQPPLGSSLVDLIERMNELEDAQTTRTDIATSAGSSTASGVSAGPAAGTLIIRKIQRVVNVTDIYGCVYVGFTSPFPTACAHVSITMIDDDSGPTAGTPIVGAQQPLTKAGFSVGWSGRGQKTTRFTYEAVGW